MGKKVKHKKPPEERKVFLVGSPGNFTCYRKTPHNPSLQRPGLLLLENHEDCSRISKIIFPRVERTNTKVQIQNTLIQQITKCEKDPTCGIFLKRGLFKDFKNYIPMCRTHKYKNTNTKYTNTAYDEVPERLNMWYIFG